MKRPGKAAGSSAPDRADGHPVARPVRAELHRAGVREPAAGPGGCPPGPGAAARRDCIHREAGSWIDPSGRPGCRCALLPGIRPPGSRLRGVRRHPAVDRSTGCPVPAAGPGASPAGARAARGQLARSPGRRPCAGHLQAAAAGRSVDRSMPARAAGRRVCLPSGSCRQPGKERARRPAGALPPGFFVDRSTPGRERAGRLVLFGPRGRSCPARPGARKRERAGVIHRAAHRGKAGRASGRGK